MEFLDAQDQRTDHALAQEIDNCIGRAMQLHTAEETLEGLTCSQEMFNELSIAVGFGAELFVANLVLTEFQPQIILHPSAHFRCLVSAGPGKLLTCSQRFAPLFYAQLVAVDETILRGVVDWSSRVGGLPKSLGDLTPLIKVHLSPQTHWPFVLADQHTPDISHLKGAAENSSYSICVALRYAAGCAHWRNIGKLSGAQLLSLLLPHERYNFILASRPLKLHRVDCWRFDPAASGALSAQDAASTNGSTSNLVDCCSRWRSTVSMDIGIEQLLRHARRAEPCVKVQRRRPQHVVRSRERQPGCNSHHQPS